VLNRIIDSFRREPQIAVVAFVAIVIGFLSLSPTVMLFYGSFLSQPLGVPGAFTLNNYVNAYSDPLTYLLLFNSFLFATAPTRRFGDFLSSRRLSQTSSRQSCWRWRGPCSLARERGSSTGH
jgi:hypothetical protein